jgi:hypothetical protein
VYTNAKYCKPPFMDHVNGIQVDISGVTTFVPLDPANTDYQNIMALVAEGKLVIQPAD